MIGLRRRWNNYSMQDSFDPADMQSGFPPSYLWRRRTLAKFRYESIFTIQIKELLKMSILCL
jgi:hypothetical protein